MASASGTFSLRATRKRVSCASTGSFGYAARLRAFRGKTSDSVTVWQSWSRRPYRRCIFFTREAGDKWTLSRGQWLPRNTTSLAHLMSTWALLQASRSCSMPCARGSRGNRLTPQLLLAPMSTVRSVKRSARRGGTSLQANTTARGGRVGELDIWYGSLNGKCRALANAALSSSFGGAILTFYLLRCSCCGGALRVVGSAPALPLSTP